ncbi:restriction endonuclease [bacterium AH-315-K03]|nr:restriction endonuclease [bacterium AH-315-K03]
MPAPKYDDLIEPLYVAMHELGGSASIGEQEEKVAEIMQLTDGELSEIHRNNKTKFSYRLAWARTYLKRFGVLTNSSRGVWVLTAVGQKENSVSKSEVKKYVQNLNRNGKAKKKEAEPEELEELQWQEQVIEVVKSISPEAFERLCQRILRESGFTSVEVTGKSGDGGIDGRGVVRIGGLLSFHVIFQCKRYQGSISPSIVRDFRGAMVGRADKGLLITTGTFTREARKEAQRDGAPPLDLIDGDDLVVKLKELGMGIEIKQKVIEEVSVDKSYFQNL